MLISEEEAKRHFRRYASPACMGVGVLVGLVYAGAIITGYIFAARIILALLLFSGGVMGAAYFEFSAMKSKVLPYLFENSRMFYFVMLVLGGVFLIAALTSDPVLSPMSLLWLQSFLVGTVGGFIWMMGLTLFVGLRYDVGEWEVIRFPVWIGVAFRWVFRAASRMARRAAKRR